MNNVYLGPGHTIEHTAHNIILTIQVFHAETHKLFLSLEIHIIAPRYQQLSSITMYGMDYTQKRFGPTEDLSTVITQFLADHQLQLVNPY